MKKLIFLFILAAVCTEMGAQVTTANNTGAATDYVGWQNTEPFPLTIQHQGNQDIQLLRNGLMKMRISEQAVWNGLNGDVENNVNRVLISHNGENNQPWSMLHLWEGTLPATMRRNWMNVGTSYTGNSDFLYTGLLNRPDSNATHLNTDAVIAWGCQDGSGNPTSVDNFRIVFLQSEAANPTLASQANQGRETFRITPTGNVGLGDFSFNGFGLSQQPTQRLDVDGTARLRQMPFDSVPQIIITGIQADTVTGDYILNYTNLNLINDGLDTLNCGWEDEFFGFATGRVDDCNPDNVSIGATPGPYVKLKVNAQSLDSINVNCAAVDVEIKASGDDATDNQRVGVRAITTRGKPAIGGFFGAINGFPELGTDAEQSVGVAGVAEGAETNIGVYGLAIRDTCLTTNIGVYGEARNPSPSCASDFAGYFVGNVAYSGSISSTATQIVLSDSGIKEDVNELEGGLDILTQLSPKSYQYTQESQEDLNTREGVSFGLIAQEVQEVLPSLVESVTLPGRLDSIGGQFSGGAELLGIKYTELIPILIQGVKEQQAEIDNLNQRLSEMEALMADIAMGRQLEMDDSKRADRPIQKDYELYQNRPNPFSTNTEIVWKMAQDASCRILVHDGSGNLIQVLQDGSRAEGLHSLIWDASDLRDGTYYYSLEVEGELLIKKAVKIQR